LVEITFLNATTRDVLGSAFLPVAYPIAAVSAAVDPSRSRLYVSTPSQSSDPRFPPNSVVSLDPATGSFGPTYSPGVLVGALALSPAGLYAVVEGTGKVVRLNPDSMQPSAEFSFRAGATTFLGYRTVLAPIPGLPDSVAMYYRPSSGSSLAQLAIFDNGVKRPNEIPVFDGPDTMLASPDGKYLFLGSARTTNVSLNILRYTFTNSGVPPQEPFAMLGGAPLAIVDGLLYTSRGAVVEPGTGELAGNLSLVGTLTLDSARKRILAVHYRTGAGNPISNVALQAFDLPTQSPLGYIDLSSANNSLAPDNPAARLFRFGNDGVVYVASSLLVFHTPLAGPAPMITADSIVGAATAAGGPISPGEVLAVHGTDLGSSTPVAATPGSDRRFPIDLAHTQVWFDRSPGTILLSYAGQINVIAPFGLEPGTNVRVQVWHYGLPSPPAILPVQSVQPGVFTRNGAGFGLVAVVNQDGSVNSPSPPGSIVSLYGTGGRTATAKDRELAVTADPVIGNVRVFIGGREARVYYAGAAPTLVHGALVFNVEVPQGLASGSVVPVRLRINGFESLQEATLAIR